MKAYSWDWSLQVLHVNLIYNTEWTRKYTEFHCQGNCLSPPVYIYYWRSKEVLLWILFVICVSCLSCCLICSLQPCIWSTAGKGLTLALLCVMLSCVFVTIPNAVLGLVWYLIVSIPGLCLLPYFDKIWSLDIFFTILIKLTKVGFFSNLF